MTSTCTEGEVRNSIASLRLTPEHIPGVVTAGDARHGSMKRVAAAAAVGEGASADRSVHSVIGVRS
jgi:thioredoxin reductase